MNDHAPTADEMWLPISGTNGLYEVSNRGRVRSYNSFGPRSVVGRKASASVRPLTLSGRGHRYGYLRVKITMASGIKADHAVHRLVLEAFVGRCPSGMECSHLNGVHTDNRVENLRWTTHRENMDARIEHQTIARGAKHGCSKLTEADVVDIRASRQSGTVLAKTYGVTYRTIRNILNRDTWSHI